MASLAYSPDGRTLAVGGDHIVRLIDARTREQLAETAVDGAAMRMAFTKDGSRLVVVVAPGSSDQTSAMPTPDHDPGRRHPGADRSLDRAGSLRRRVRRLSGTRHPSFPLTPDGRSLVTASEDGELALVGSPEPQEDADAGDRDRPRATRSRSARTVCTVAVGIEHGVQLVDLRAGTVRTAAGALAGARTGCSSARTARRSCRRTSTGR